MAVSLYTDEASWVDDLTRRLQRSGMPVNVDELVDQSYLPR